MPSVKEGESEQAFVNRCVPIVLEEGTAKDEKQAAAICYSMYRRHKGEHSEFVEFEFDGEYVITEEPAETQAGEYSSSNDQPGMITRRIVAFKGNMFKKGRFMSADAIKNSIQNWNGTLHDINHFGTTHSLIDPRPDIRFFVGYHDNAEYDEETKTATMNVHIDENTMYGKTWSSYVDLCAKAGRTPNVSVSILGKVEYVKAKNLPEGADYKQFGYQEDDFVPTFTEVYPVACSTVLRGAWSDKDGCGIVPPTEETPDENSEDSDSNADEIEKKRQELIKELRKLDDGE